MITDPDEPGYRYPQPGERLWHVNTRTMLEVLGEPSYGPVPDEVDVVSLTSNDGAPAGRRMSVKLRNVDPVQLCGILAEHEPHPWQLFVDAHQAVPVDARDRWCDGSATPRIADVDHAHVWVRAELADTCPVASPVKHRALTTLDRYLQRRSR